MHLTANYHPVGHRGGALKFIRVMRLTAILLLTACLQVSARTEGQTITLAAKNKPLERVFGEIKKQSGFSFIYGRELINSARRVNVNVKNEPLVKVLELIFHDQPLDFKISDNYIVISPKPPVVNQAGDRSEEEPLPPIQISGRVTDEAGKPLAGASIKLKGAQGGTSTDDKGEFTFSIPGKGGILIISYVGYRVQEIPVNKSGEISVKLSLEDNKTEEIVVIGYGTARRRDLTGSIATLSNESYKDQPVVNASSALQGRVAGVAVTNNSGAPGGSVKIRIRGANSINANNDPLYVVDGIALSSIGLGDLNVNDIESMEVLKDASATAVYGSRGANGVILITTKSGKSGIPRVEYNSFVSFNKPMKKYDLMDAVTYAKTANLTAGASVFADPQSFAGKGTDWQDLIFANSTTQSHQVSVAGGKEGTKYYISGFYIDQGGLLVNSNQKRFGLRSNLDMKLSKKIDLGINVYAGRLNSHNNGDMGSKGNPVTSALTWAPTEQVYDAPGQYNRFGISPIWANPYMTIKERDGDNYSNVGVFNGRFRYAITDWLTLTVNGGLDMNISKYAYLNNDWISPGNPGSGQSSSENYTFQNSNVLTFHRSFGDHDLTVTALEEATSNKYTSFSASGSGLSSISNGYYNLGLNTSQSIASGYSNWSLLSFMGRAAYSYNDKYLLTATIRRDGSSKFQGNNKWSSFPSFSAGWKLSNEKFIQALGVFSNLKLRAGWGVTGNQAIGPYSTLGLLNGVIYSYGTASVYQGYTLGNPATPNVKWETSKQTDIGLDVGLLGGRLNITADYYNKNTSDLLLLTRIANYDGGGNYLKNIGKVNNKGWEFLIEGTLYKEGNFTWSTAFNGAWNQNKVINLGKDSLLERPLLTGGGLISAPIQVVKVGQPMGAFYLIPWQGVYQSDKGIYKAGDAKYRDVDGNGSVGFEDRVISGSAMPKFTWGFNNNFSYKNFELNIFIQGSQGNKIFNATYASTAVPTSDVKFINLADAANYWTPSNTGSTWANPASKNKSWVESTQFLQDGSYVRLKNVSLSYTLGKSLLKVLSAKIYVSAQNIATITKYKGFDPEASTMPAGSDVDAGIELGAYPSPKTVTVGVQLKF